MIRSVAFVLHALTLIAPYFNQKQQAAELLVELGRQRHFDPLTLVVIVEHESHWLPSSISKDGRDFGLAQIRATNYASCRAPVLVEECESRKRWLLEWDNNLREAAAIIEANREYCKKTVGTDLAIYWLQQFQGFGSRTRVCGHVRKRGRWFALEVPQMTRDVLARRRELTTRSLSTAWRP